MSVKRIAGRPSRQGDPTARTVVGPSVAREPAGAGLAPANSDGQLVDEGEIGSGGSGSVRRAYDPNLRRAVATKVLSPNLGKNPDFIRRFVEEARVMARLDHPNIVPVHDLVVDGDRWARVRFGVGSQWRETALRIRITAGRCLTT